MSARSLGSPDYRTEIVRILYLVTDYDERILTLFLRDLEQPLGLDIFRARTNRDNALV